MSLDHGKDHERQTWLNCSVDERRDGIEVKSRIRIEVARSLLQLASASSSSEIGSIRSVRSRAKPFGARGAGEGVRDLERD